MEALQVTHITIVKLDDELIVFQFPNSHWVLSAYPGKYSKGTDVEPIRYNCCSLIDGRLPVIITMCA